MLDLTILLPGNPERIHTKAKQMSNRRDNIVKLGSPGDSSRPKIKFQGGEHYNHNFTTVPTKVSKVITLSEESITYFLGNPIKGVSKSKWSNLSRREKLLSHLKDIVHDEYLRNNLEINVIPNVHFFYTISEQAPSHFRTLQIESEEEPT